MQSQNGDLELLYRGDIILMIWKGLTAMCSLQHLFLNSQTQISMSIDRYHSLPKKNQPSLSKLTTTANSAVRPSLLYTEPAQCPQISEFTHKHSKSREKIYIHNLNIDYGRLQRPECLGKDEKIESRLKFDASSGDERIEMETKRMTGISELLQGSRNNKNTEKKVISKQYYLQLEPTPDTPLRKSNKKHFQPSKQQTRGKSTRKLHQVRAYENIQSRESGRKVLHSRIIKMIVGGGSAKTKVICYPDDSDYKRLISHRQ